MYAYAHALLLLGPTRVDRRKEDEDEVNGSFWKRPCSVCVCERSGRRKEKRGKEPLIALRPPGERAMDF